MRASRAGGLVLGRRMIAALAVGLSATVAFAVIAHGGSPHADSTVVVQPGDTLWSIAAAHYPSDDVRVRVDDIERANGLQDPTIEPGETLRLPG